MAMNCIAVFMIKEERNIADGLKNIDRRLFMAVIPALVGKPVVGGR